MAALTLREIVARLGGEAGGGSSTPATGVATPDAAGASDAAVLANPRDRAERGRPRSGVCRDGHEARPV